MHYYCVENNQLVSIANYKPNTPASVICVEIDDVTHKSIERGEWWFNLDSMCAEPRPQTMLDHMAADAEQQANRTFLAETDWQVLRHLRQQALGIETSLTHDQYLDLERRREAAATAI